MEKDDVKQVDLYTTREISTFLELWGTSFKGLNIEKHPQAEAYYQACADAHQNINGRRMHFYTVSGLRRTLLLMGDDFMVEFTSKRQDETYKYRAELCTHIAESLLKTLNTEGVQQNLFQ
jgi:hypothetical protein